MNVKAVEQELREKYSGKNIVQNKLQGEVVEIICELGTQDARSSEAIAVVDLIQPHKHKVTTESYIILKGSLELYLDGIKHVLHEQDEITILPNTIHHGVANECWLRCISKPGWSVEDYYICIN